ncbi:MAG TPA: Mur ligase family protein, partial [Arachidicoccus sp.]
MKTLQDILHKVHLTKVNGLLNEEIFSVQIDSRKVVKNTLFVALKGVQSDGHTFIDKAISLGANAIVCEVMPDVLQGNVTYVQVRDSHEAAAIIAHNFYDAPSQKIKLVGVTGTNGKTTIATLLFNLFTGLGYKCGLISTVQNKIGDEIIPATHTTPDAISLSELLAKMVDENCTHVFMECSSHAIHQHRISGLNFTGALFTNI